MMRRIKWNLVTLTLALALSTTVCALAEVVVK